jgi:redox-sensing transcriptional repressor
LGIPAAARERLLKILRLLETGPVPGGGGALTSAELEALSGLPRKTIRKDISYLISGSAGPADGAGAVGSCAGYSPEVLGGAIRRALGLDRRRKFCVVGLGRLGSAYLNAAAGPDPLDYGEFELAAGFDTNVNRVEILKSPVPLFPAYKMAEVAGRLGLEIALLCVPAEAAQGAAERCAASGIRGIVSFAPAALKLPAGIAVRNVYVTDELRALAVHIQDNEKRKEFL